MGLFKKIGNAVKKGLKQVSLKNVVKIGTPLLSAIPVFGGIAQNVVSGISDAHELKKQEKAARDAGNQQQADLLAQQAAQAAAQSGAYVGQQAGSVVKAFSKGATDELIAQTSASTKSAAGNVGAAIADESIKAWFSLHWKQLLIGLGIVGAFVFYSKNNKKKPVGRRY
ncbi:hypothetical protein [Flavobacterium sp. ov086]|uniref:hypothetical protein n=1 Tax=Flavobacterium sp. ov086 TaxID=1761785 RepID=UPI000B66FFBB|nr:hypothetical protein [Flavobacterium sp. ov086]SNS02519.1 hypothetical protein SAMN04487979_14514 [Flavobacterium sp. ov086]